jgi:hypothetical protein
MHRLDAAHLYRLAVEKGSAGARYHGVDEARRASGFVLTAYSEVILR